MTLPPIAIFHVDTVSPSGFHEFRESISRSRLQVAIIPREPPGPMASLEWLTPTVVIGFIASAYFGGFLQELGKDHYTIVKQQFRKLYRQVAGPEAPEVKIISSSGKSAKVQKYSLYFSVVGETSTGLKLKLLIPQSITQTDYETMIDRFLDYLEEVNSEHPKQTLLKKLQESNPIGRTALLVYDNETRTIAPIDPRTGEIIR